jgi:hypothetical protein
MGKPAGLGPRQVAMQQAAITKEEANKQIAAQAAAGVPPAQMVFVNPETKVVVPANMEQGSAPETIQDIASAPTAVQVAMAATPSRYIFLGFEYTSWVAAWNGLMDKLGLKSGKMALGQKYKTNQYDGTISELERRR